MFSTRVICFLHPVPCWRETPGAEGQEKRGRSHRFAGHMHWRKEGCVLEHGKLKEGIRQAKPVFTILQHLQIESGCLQTNTDGQAAEATGGNLELCCTGGQIIHPMLLILEIMN